MSEDFFGQLGDYYAKVVSVLRGEAEAASIFPNSTDVGMSRERVYAEFLRLHAPSKCNVFFGGFLFDMDGNTSSQMDIIIANDTAPRFNFQNKDGAGKSFSPVEGTLGIASVKSMLNKEGLEDALLGIASIPPMGSLEDRVAFDIQILDYDDWPYKILYASDGIQGVTLFRHLLDFYAVHPDIPTGRRPNIIHVAGKYAIMRVGRGKIVMSSSGQPRPIEVGQFHLFDTSADLQAVVWVLDELQQKAQASTQILYSYVELANKVISRNRGIEIPPISGGEP